MTQHTLELPDVDLVYDVHGPLPPADGRPPLVMIGQPMDASGFKDQVRLFDDRTVVTYDPRGLGRSRRKDGGVTNEPETQAEDIHAIIEELGAGPVDMLASSGGAVTALALVTAYPDDVSALVAHEPPIDCVLPDAQAVHAARLAYTQVYLEKGWGAGMAAFIGMTSWEGEVTDEYLAQPPPDPAAFGMPTEDNGTRDDPLLSDRSWSIPFYRPDLEALKAAATRIVVAVGEESVNVYTGRAAIALAGQLGQQATVFPSHHGGFMGGEFGYAGQPEAFAAKLREVLDQPREGADGEVSSAPATLYAQVPYRDAPAALRWLERAFGFTTVAEWPDDEGGVQHAEMRFGDAAFTVFTDRAGYVRPEPRGESVGFGLVLTLPSSEAVDSIHRSAIAAGAVDVIAPADTEWGNYRCRVRDIEGYEWTFGTYKPGEPQDWSDDT